MKSKTTLCPGVIASYIWEHVWNGIEVWRGYHNWNKLQAGKSQDKLVECFVIVKQHLWLKRHFCEFENKPALLHWS